MRAPLGRIPGVRGGVTGSVQSPLRNCSLVQAHSLPSVLQSLECYSKYFRYNIYIFLISSPLPAKKIQHQRLIEEIGFEDPIQHQDTQILPASHQSVRSTSLYLILGIFSSVLQLISKTVLTCVLERQRVF